MCRRAVAAHLPPNAPSGAAVLACSGGPDSVALVRAAAAVTTATGWRIEAVVIDHGLQPGSADIAAGAQALCSGLGVSSRIVHVTVPEGPGGIEATARAARYAALRACATEIGADRILLGHTREDQAETVLMRLARGSGARTLSGMASVAGDLHRPFLGLPRATVHATVADLSTWADPHNADPRFLRARVRAELLPVLTDVLGPAAIDGLARTAELLRDDADALDEWAVDALRQCSDDADTTASSVGLDVSRLLAVPRAVRTRILRSAAVAVGAPAGSLTRNHIDAVEALISAWCGQGEVALPGPVTAHRRYGRLYLERSGPATEGDTHAP